MHIARDSLLYSRTDRDGFEEGKVSSFETKLRMASGQHLTGNYILVKLPHRIVDHQRSRIADH
jgi:hypothetical protein